jgi:hypothetical protein
MTNKKCFTTKVNFDYHDKQEYLILLNNPSINKSIAYKKKIGIPLMRIYFAKYFDETFRNNGFLNQSRINRLIKK